MMHSSSSSIMPGTALIYMEMNCKCATIPLYLLTMNRCRARAAPLTREKVCLFIEWTIPAAFRKREQPIFILHSKHDFSLWILVNGTSWLTRISTYLPQNHWWWFCQGKNLRFWRRLLTFFCYETTLVLWAQQHCYYLQDYHTLEKNGVRRCWDKRAILMPSLMVFSALHFGFFKVLEASLGCNFQFIVKT